MTKQREFPQYEWRYCTRCHEFKQSGRMARVVRGSRKQISPYVWTEGVYDPGLAGQIIVRCHCQCVKNDDLSAGYYLYQRNEHNWCLGRWCRGLPTFVKYKHQERAEATFRTGGYAALKALIHERKVSK